MVKIMENPIKEDDLGGFPPIFGNTHIVVLMKVVDFQGFTYFLNQRLHQVCDFVHDLIGMCYKST